VSADPRVLEEFAIVDRETGAPATAATFLRREDAESMIALWIRRQAAGGRPDISAEKLARLEVVPGMRVRL
jgi:hypothetical protein